MQICCRRLINCKASVAVPSPKSQASDSASGLALLLALALALVLCHIIIIIASRLRLRLRANTFVVFCGLKYILLVGTFFSSPFFIPSCGYRIAARVSHDFAAKKLSSVLRTRESESKSKRCPVQLQFGICCNLIWELIPRSSYTEEVSIYL